VTEHMTRAPRILVIGAGVAGCTLSRALARAGISSRIFDSAPASHRTPRGLGLWPNSQKCLREIGLAEFLDSEAQFVPPAAYRGVDGTWLSGCSAHPSNLRRVACLEQNGLLSALQGPALTDSPALDITWGKQVVRVSGITPGAGREPLKVWFSDGTHEEGDLVVGADGAHSQVRNSVFPHASLVYSGKTCLSAVVDVAATDLPFETLGRSVGHWHLGIRPGAPLRFAAIPLRDSRLFWFATLQAPRNLNGSPRAKPLQACMAADFAQWHDPIPRLISAHRPEEDLLCEAVMELSEPLPAWSRGRAVLLGDACAPLSHNLAQSASVAIEGALLLATALARNLDSASSLTEPSLLTALAQYEDALRDRVQACRTVTGFTKMLAAMPEISNFMQFVPHPLNGWVFDTFLNYSLSGRLLPHRDPQWH
jgi:2-polyprenyl-6-methoxyphenol hydroxylase-like FAD-dependent oxidoreductase